MAVAVGVTAATAEVSLPCLDFAVHEKTLTGSMYGSCRPSIDIPIYLRLYQSGHLVLEELVSMHYTLLRCREVFQALLEGGTEGGNSTRGGCDALPATSRQMVTVVPSPVNCERSDLRDLYLISPCPTLGTRPQEHSRRNIDRAGVELV